MTSRPAVLTSGLTKQFRDVTAVDHLDLQVEHGEVFGFLGPNGAGKTTTLRLLLDFVRPTSGRAEVLGAPAGDVATRGRIGYLPGDLHLDPSYTAAEVFAYFGDLRGGVDAAVLDGLVERFSLDPTRPLRDLSTGNRRKVGVVQAFMSRPDLLLLDEPTSGLDPLLQQEFHLVVKEAVRDGATVFLSSHVLSEVEALADRVGVVRAGRLVAVAGVDELRAQSRTRLELHFAEPVDVAEFDTLAGVVEAVATGNVLRLVVEGSVDPVVKAAARHVVLRVVPHDTGLEDAFLAFYGEPT